MRADADSRLRPRPDGAEGCVMPNSQIDMVVRDDDGVRWNVCGDFQVPTEQLDPKIYVCVVVRQGDVIARGDDVVSSRSWRFEVKPEGGRARSRAARDRVSGGHRPGGPIGPGGVHLGPAGRRPAAQDRRQPRTRVRPARDSLRSGELAAGHAISSSLTVKEAEATAGDGSLSWEHMLQTS